MPYEAQCRISVPFIKDGVVVPEGAPGYKEPRVYDEGDQVTKSDLTEYGQTQEDISRLVKSNALKEA